MDCNNCSKLTSLNGIGSVGIKVECLGAPLEQPSATLAKMLLQNKIDLWTHLSAPWLDLQCNYCTTGDLLAAIAKFEEIYQVSFAETGTAPNDVATQGLTL